MHGYVKIHFVDVADHAKRVLLYCTLEMTPLLLLAKAQFNKSQEQLDWVCLYTEFPLQKKIPQPEISHFFTVVERRNSRYVLQHCLERSHVCAK